MKRSVVFAWAAASAFLAGLFVWLAFFWEPDPAGYAGGARQETAASRPNYLAGGDFTLDGPDGKLSLHDYRGQAVLIYFGYTFCPDVCPTALAVIAEALRALPSEEAARARGIFISVDPERDTPDVLKAYAPFFHPGIVGATGTPEQVAEVARRYGVLYMKQKPIDGRPYTVDHSSMTYLVAPDGALAAVLPHGASATEIVAALRKTLAAPPAN
jgi:protein SCO1/2